MRYDLVLVGGGLANGLLAYRLSERRPDLSILVLESGARPGGNHTWSFHATDLTPAETAWIAPFVVHAWPDYDVAFPGFARTVGLGYRSVSSERFAAVVERTLGTRLRPGVAVAELAPTHVTLSSGERIDAIAVVDGRGPREARALDLAYQKFVGQEVRLAEPHGLSRPILMDATVAQIDGYRFVYVLPFGPDRLLVEDTCYSDGASLDEDAIRVRIDRYLRAKGWNVAEVLREEAGVLPIALGGDMEAFWRDPSGPVPRVGLRAALFHPTTGYSLPDAVRLADHVSSLPDLSAPALFDAIRDWSTRRWRKQNFFRLLNKMMFRAGDPARRFEMLRRFYALPEPLIARFYAGSLSPVDKVRLLAGKPPVPLLGAARALFTAAPLRSAS